MNGTILKLVSTQLQIWLKTLLRVLIKLMERIHLHHSLTPSCESSTYMDIIYIIQNDS